jgi:zinc protease
MRSKLPLMRLRDRPEARYRPKARYRIAFTEVLAALAVLAGLVASAPAARALKVEEIVSPKGVKAWLVEEHSVPLVAIRFALMGGSAQDPPGSEGLAAIVADLLTEGAGDMPAQAFKERLAELGTHLTASSGRDALYGGMETLSKRFAPSAELLRLVLLSPRFDADAIERVKAQRLTDLALAANEPSKLAGNRWYAEAFSGHAYGRPADGTPESVGRIGAEAIKAMHAELLARNALRVVIVGDIDKSGATEALDSVFGALPAAGKAVHVERLEPRVLPAPVVIDKDYPLATATFGMPSLNSDSPDFPALQVLNHVIGSGDFDSRLMEEIRVKRGLAYTVQTRLLRDTVTSLLVGGLATKNESMGAALSLVKDVLADMARNGPTPAQFDNAKRYLTGSFLLDFDTNAKVAGSLLTIQLLGERPDYLVVRNQRIAAVTLEAVKRVAGQVLKPERLVVTIVGRPKLSP